MRITDIVKFFGCSPQNKELDAYLTSIGIIERPEFEENPAEDISLKSEGYTLSFRAQRGYERNWGLAQDNLGSMIFNEVRVYSSNNDSGYKEYKGDLPYKLSFSSTLDSAKKILGEPYMSQPFGTEDKVYTWYNLSGITIDICFLSNDKGISFISIEKAQKNAPKKLDW